MSDSSWVLKGVEPEVREKAVAEAARLGMNVGDYLADKLLRCALIDQVNALAEAEPAPTAHEEAMTFALPPESPEGFAVRHRLKGLERRLSASVGSLDGAVHAVDTALYDVTARLGETEALAGDTAHALGQTQIEINNTVTGLQLHIAVLEDNLGALGQAHEDRTAGLTHRIDYVQQSTAVLADAHEALKHAVAEDFSSFAHEIADRLSGGLHDVRASADAAAEQADAAVAHLIQELRTMRDVLDQRVADGVAESRARVQAAFAETSERIAGLTDRVAENERFNSRVSEQLRAQIADVEDGAQIALEETAQGLRQTDSVLAADIALTAQESRAALENTRAALSAEIIAVREDQISQLARLKLVDVAVGNTINELGMVREAVENRLRAALEDAQSETDARFDALSGRTNNNERETAHLRQTLIVEVERVEASTFASLEKLARDIASSDTAAQNHLEAAARTLRAELADLRNHVSAELGRIATDTKALREDQTGIAARLTLMDGALARVEESASPLAARLAALEEAAGGVETEQALALIRQQIEALTERADDRRVEHTLTERLASVEARTGAADESLQGVARMLNRVAAQSVESATRAEERAHQVELAMADMRLDHISLNEKANIGDLVLALEVRVAGMEQRQTDALHTLRNDIARFVADNDARLATLEDAPAPTPLAAPAASTDDMLAAFQDLRTRIEDRIHGIEQRSVRTLEQVADTVAMIEQRFIEANTDAERDVKSA